MEHADYAVSQNIASLRRCSAMIRGIPPLWPFWWPVLCACEAEVARIERALARQPRALADTVPGEVIDLGEWRRRNTAALVRRRQSAGGAE